VHTAEHFAVCRRQVAEARAGVQQAQVDVQNHLIELGGEKKQLGEQAEEVNAELRSLRSRKSNIPRVNLVENEITYLAFPLTEGAMVIFGAGYAVPVLEPLGWLAGVDLVYWGDIDTHGFAIRDRLRRRFPHARSMLMDRGTLLAHRSQWVTEPNPSAGRLDFLDAEESQLYQHLVADALGPSVRLEQERVSFAAIHQATLDV
jgi:hypothetical protein